MQTDDFEDNSNQDNIDHWQVFCNNRSTCIRGEKIYIIYINKYINK